MSPVRGSDGACCDGPRKPLDGALLIIGDTRDVTRSLPDGSVDLILTSPPFLALRSYLPADHPDKAKEIGSEATPGEFLDVLLDLAEEWRRVLAPHGSIAVELGDTYAGSGGAGGDYGTKDPGAKGLRDGQPKFTGSAIAARRTRNANRASGEKASNTQGGRRVRSEDEELGRDEMDGWPMDKSLSLIPEMFRFALAYGVNPLTGRQTDRWRIRNVIRWCRPNPPVGALGDKFRPGTSEMVIATIDRRRYFDLDAVRHPSDYDRPNLRGKGSRPGGTPPGQKENTSDHTVNPAGAPPLDWWEIPTEPYKGSHYATFPTALLTKPILAMTPERVCLTCGEPSRRIVEVTYEEGSGGTTGVRRNLAEPDGRTNGTGMTGKKVMDRHAETTGWTDCGHDNWRRGIVLDPFAGSGTTLLVATGHGRNAIGIDIDERNADLARERVGMFLDIEHFTKEAVA